MSIKTQEALFVDYRQLECKVAQNILLEYLGADIIDFSARTLAIADACIHHTKACLNQECIFLGQRISARQPFIDELEKRRVAAIISSG